MKVGVETSVTGLVLLPDYFALPEDSGFVNGAVDYNVNVYTNEEWTKMEASGAVFLPACGYRYSFENKTNMVQFWGGYWTSILGINESNQAFCKSFGGSLNPSSAEAFREECYAIRLVKTY